LWTFTAIFIAVLLVYLYFLVKNKVTDKDLGAVFIILGVAAGTFAYICSGSGYNFKEALEVYSVLFAVAYILYAEVMRENAYLSRTVKVEEGQKVVDTGPYSIVRHPMYMATILLFLMIPIVLGSWYALIVFAFYPAIIIVRLKDEEDLLTRELPGYAEYKQKVKYRIIPFVW
jgi:protein-S-isoprenylcysteine O-methyltransferase Ste14